MKMRFSLLTILGLLALTGVVPSATAANVPTVSLTANPTSIYMGEWSFLSWSSTDAISCVASGEWSGTKGVSGSSVNTGKLYDDSVFTLTCTGPGGSAQSSATVTMKNGSTTPTVSLTASPTSVNSGSASTLTWSSTNTTSCTASGGWSGSKTVSGSASTGALTVATTYTLSCTGAGGTVQASRTVTIKAATPVPTVNFSASPLSVVVGNSSTLTWSTSNATSCTASGGWSGTKALSGSASTGALSADNTFNLSCTGSGGTTQKSATVTVTQPTPVPSVSLTASPSSVASGGASVLTWSSANVTTCTASGGWSGDKGLTGNESTDALTVATTYTLSCTGDYGTVQANATVNLIGATTMFPLHTEAGKRYLVDAQNRPFLITGDAAWSLIVELTRENADLYLETRRQQGFNAVLVNLIEHQFSAHVPKNAYGAAPFTTAGNFGTPNEAYFAHAEYVIAKAQEKGMLVLLAPAYEGYQGGSEGWYSEMQANGTTKLRTYGQYVANRFKNYDNILWIEGGDYDAPDKTLARAVANGIKDVDTTGKWLQTFHGARGTAALEYTTLTADPWITANDIYTNTETVVAEAQKQYAGSTLPFFLIEAGYEGNDTDGTGVRTQAYQAVFSGASGHVMGNFPVWYFGSGWQSALSSNGGSTVGYLPQLFTSTGIDWTALVPDTNSTVLTSAAGSGSGRSVAARSSNGSAVVVFTPSSKTLTINMTKLTGLSVTARWYNPATGTFTAISGSPFTNTGSRSFASPSGRDSVLVLQSQ